MAHPVPEPLWSPLNRFGFGARRRCRPIWLMRHPIRANTAKAELSRPSGALLEVPGLLPTPALAEAGVRLSRPRSSKRARRRRKSAAPASGLHPRRRRRGRGQQTRNLSLNAIAMDIAARRRRDEGCAERQRQRGDVQSTDASQPNAMQPAATLGRARQNRTPQPLNIIQKTYRAEALARLQHAQLAPIAVLPSGWWRSWSNHF